MTEIILIGSGGHARVIIDIIQQVNTFRIIGVTSKSLKAGSSFCGYPVLGDDSVLTEIKKKGDIEHVAIGVGGFRDNLLRTELFKKIKAMGFTIVNAIHPSVCISPTAFVGEGVTIYPGTVINTSVKIGNNVIIATGVSIDHEATIGNNVLISTGSAVGAYSIIKDNALLALGSSVVAGITIGINSIVAAGGVVVNDIPDNSVVYGIPAKPKC
jgi:sugar O-acyltransferase (sialic acid O-acetyltransferase NeuD family)